jgi:hypothetical protein
VYQADGSNFTAENWRGTRLFGWKGCGKKEKNIIIETWEDFHTLSWQDALQDIDWNSQAAQEIWGHSNTPSKMISAETKAQIQQIYHAAAAMYDHWWSPPYIRDPPWPWPGMLWIRVQCSPDGDDAGICLDKCPAGQPAPPPGNKPPMEAYSDNNEKYSKITFCDYFFNGRPRDKNYPPMLSLSEVKSKILKNRNLRNDLWKYQNRARIMFHEITHLDYFMSAPKESPYVDDVRVTISKTEKNAPVYGPRLIKVLANWERAGKGGFYTQRNADSYAWFAMAKWAENLIGQ